MIRSPWSGWPIVPLDLGAALAPGQVTVVLQVDEPEADPVMVRLPLSVYSRRAAVLADLVAHQLRRSLYVLLVDDGAAA